MGPSFSIIHLLLPLLIILILVSPNIGQIATDDEHCQFCTSSCDRAHDALTNLPKSRFKVTKGMHSNTKTYIDEFEDMYDKMFSDVDTRVNQLRNLLHYTWNKVDICTNKVSTFVDNLDKQSCTIWPENANISEQLAATYQLLLDFKVLHDDAHCVAFMMKWMPKTMVGLKASDPTATIANPDVKSALKLHYVFRIYKTIEDDPAAWANACEPVQDFLNWYNKDKPVIFVTTRLKFMRDQFVFEAAKKFQREQVRRSIDNEMALLCAQISTNREIYETFLGHLLESLFYSRAMSKSASAAVKPIEAVAFKDYLTPVGLWLLDKEFLLSDLEKLINKYASKRSTSKPYWFEMPAIFDRRLLNFHQTVVKMLKTIETNDGSSPNELVADFSRVIWAIDDDFCTDRVGPTAILDKDYCTKILFIAASNALLDSPKGWWKKHWKKVAGTAGAVGVTFILGGLAWYFWPFGGTNLPPFATNLSTMGNVSFSTNLTSMVTTGAPPLSAVAITMIVLGSTVAFLVLLGVSFCLFKMARAHSAMSISMDTKKSKIVGGQPKKETTGTTFSIVSSTFGAKTNTTN